MGSGGQRSVKRRATGGAVASAKAQASTVAAAATSAGSTGGGGAAGRGLFGTEKFSSLSRSQQEQIVNDSLSAPQKKSPSAYDSGYQKFVNNSGLDGKPQLMDSDEFDKASGPVIYRTINTDPWGMKAKDIVESTANDDTFLYNAGGGMAHGVGLYTTPSYDGSRVYGDNYNSTKTSMMRFKIRDDAKIGSAPDIKAQYLKESKKKGTLAYKLANDQRITSRAAGRSHMDDSRIGIYAASKGYSVLVESSGLTTQKQFRQLLSSGSDVYTVVLNRGALIMDKNAKQIKRNGSGVKWQNLKTNSKVK
mgnify:FL=1